MKNLKKDTIKPGKWWILGFVVSFIALKIVEHYFGEDFIVYDLIFALVLMTAIVGGVYAAFIIIFGILDLGAKVTGKTAKRFGGLEKIDFVKAKEYYRDILTNYSPLALGYIDEFKISKNHLVAEILWLKTKGLIDFDAENVIDNSYNKKNLIKSFDNMFLESLKNRNLKAQNVSLIEDRILESFIEQNMIHEKKKDSKKIDWLFMTAISFFVGIVLMGVGGILDVFSDKVLWLEKISLILSLISAIGLIIGFFMMILYILVGFFKVNYVEARGKKVARSSKGKEINEKLEGLKSYFQDYSMLSEREAKEVELWEDYLIYSVMFGHNKKIVEEYEKYIDIQ